MTFFFFHCCLGIGAEGRKFWGFVRQVEWRFQKPRGSRTIGKTIRMTRKFRLDKMGNSSVRREIDWENKRGNKRTKYHKEREGEI